MDTPIEATASVKLGLPCLLTSADVLKWLRICAEESGIPGLQLQAVSHEGWERFLASTDYANTRNGATVHEAIEKFRASIPTPEQRAAQKRAEAEKLLREAGEILNTAGVAVADGKEAA